MATLGTFVAGQVLTAAELNDIGTWTAYSPTLTASTTNPTLGSGGSITGRWTRLNDLIIGSVYVLFGTSGVAAGTGEYRISLPVNASTGNVNIIAGQAWCYDGNVTTARHAIFQTLAGTYGIMQLTDNATITVGAANPFTWAANDQIRVQFMYEAA